MAWPVDSAKRHCVRFPWTMLSPCRGLEPLLSEDVIEAAHETMRLHPTGLDEDVQQLDLAGRQLRALGVAWAPRFDSTIAPTRVLG
jgi:hypothetical protein